MSKIEERNLVTAASICMAWNSYNPEGFAEHFAEEGVGFLGHV